MATKTSRRGSGRRRRPRSTPRVWNQPRLPRRWRRPRGTDPLLRPPKGRTPFWTALRHLFWSWWPWALLTLWAVGSQRWWWAVGLGAMALICHLITPAEFPPRYGLDHEFSIDSDEFVPTMIGATGVHFTAGNRIEILNNGDEFYPAMLGAIAAAECSITVEAYIYWAGEIGLKFADALADKARSGVKVKVLLDAVGSSTIGDDIYNTLEGGGCQVAWYNPIRLNTIGRFNNRTHRKSLIVDGRLGFTGGAGIADHWQGCAQDADHWRDIQIQMEGPCVAPLQTGFSQNWLECTGELVSGPIFYPPLDKAGTLSVQTLMSSPQTGASSVQIMYYLSIVCARRSVLIVNPYFVPDQVAIDTLIEAKKRGVRVRIMVSGVRNDNWLARQNSVRLYGRLLEAGIEILEYNRTMLHQKTMVIDGLWSTIGTTNFDNRSFAHNEESNVCVHDKAMARELEEIFLADASLCQVVDLAGWRRRGVIARVQEVVAAFFQEQV
jgi:cardiolipin synthase